MKRHLTTALSGLFILGMIGCKDFLIADKAVNDPNNPSVATKDQLLVGTEANLMGVQEGPMAMLVCEWMQQCAGIGGRFVDTQGGYVIQDGSFEGPWDAIYSQGGLVALRQLEAQAETTKDPQIKGIAEVMEAIQVGTAADIWGDVPYAEAGTVATPKPDPQLVVYASLQTLLDKAIADLTAGGSSFRSSDLFFGGSKSKWIALANTIKARLYLHTVEKVGASQYAMVIAAASKGISSPDGDLLAVHTTASGQQNIWYQFQQTSFGSDLVAGATLVNIMNARNDPRLPDYFGANGSGSYIGYDVVTGDQNPDFATIVNAGRNSPTFGQPLATFVENQLILAEAYFQTSGAAAAQPYFNAARAAIGSAPIPATLADIMTEKYIALFQNLETWNDYKRTCLPKLKPAPGTSFNQVPGRVYYPQQEVQVNPFLPKVDVQRTTNEFRNPNDPTKCP